VNYRNFKKVHEDNDKAIMRNEKGHSITISKKALSPKHLEELRKLPLHAFSGADTEDQADTADVSMDSADNEPKRREAPHTVINIGQPAQAASPTQAPAPMQQPQQPPVLAAPARAPQSVESPAPAQAPVPAAEPAAPVQPEVPPSQPQPPQANEPLNPFQQAHQMALQKYMAEDKAWQNDLNNGHITPETYHDLFAKKSTLGKIGTAFGLLLSGAGSGLAHQPNAALSLMQQEIQNDLDAQKTSKANALNYIAANQKQMLMRAEIPKLVAEGKLTQAQAQLAQAEAGQKAFALSQMQMNRTAFHYLVQQTQKLPVGSPQRTAAENTLAMMYQAINNENFSIADRAAAASALANFGNSSEPGSIQQKSKVLTMAGNPQLASYMEERNVPGFEGQASQPVPQDVRNQLAAQKQYDEKAREYVEFAKKHKANWANLNIAQRQAIANQGAAMGANLQSLYRNKIKGGVYKKGEQEFIEQIIPDQPAKWSAGFNAIPKVEQTIKDNEGDIATTAGSVGLKVPKKEAARETASGKATHKEGQTGTFNGKPVVFKNGKWSYK